MAQTTYKKPTQRPIIPTPANASDELHHSLVGQMVSHYAEVLTPTIMIANRKGAYATVINTTIDNVPLEQILGTINAKVATEQVLQAVTAKYSAIITK